MVESTDEKIAPMTPEHVEAATIMATVFAAGLGKPAEVWREILTLVEGLSRGKLVVVPTKEIERMRHLVTQLYLGEDANNDSDEQMIEAHGRIDRWLSGAGKEGATK